MSTELTVQQKFEEKIKDKLRESIGDLLPDEILKGMVEKATKEIFFQKKIDTNSYSRNELPSWFEAEVTSLLKAKLGAQVNAVVQGKKNEMEKYVKDAIRDKLPQMIAALLIELMQANTNNMMSSVYNWLNNQPKRY